MTCVGRRKKKTGTKGSVTERKRKTQGRVVVPRDGSKFTQKGTGDEKGSRVKTHLQLEKVGSQKRLKGTALAEKKGCTGLPARNPALETPPLEGTNRHRRVVPRAGRETNPKGNAHKPLGENFPRREHLSSCVPATYVGETVLRKRNELCDVKAPGQKPPPAKNSKKGSRKDRHGSSRRETGVWGEEECPPSPRGQLTVPILLAQRG